MECANSGFDREDLQEIIKIRGKGGERQESFMVVDGAKWVVASFSLPSRVWRIISWASCRSREGDL